MSVVVALLIEPADSRAGPDCSTVCCGGSHTVSPAEACVKLGGGPVVSPSTPMRSTNSCCQGRRSCPTRSRWSKAIAPMAAAAGPAPVITSAEDPGGSAAGRRDVVEQRGVEQPVVGGDDRADQLDEEGPRHQAVGGGDGASAATPRTAGRRDRGRAAPAARCSPRRPGGVPAPSRCARWRPRPGRDADGDAGDHERGGGRAGGPSTTAAAPPARRRGSRCGRSPPGQRRPPGWRRRTRGARGEGERGAQVDEAAGPAPQAADDVVNHGRALHRLGRRLGHQAEHETERQPRHPADHGAAG